MAHVRYDALVVVLGVAAAASPVLAGPTTQTYRAYRPSQVGEQIDTLSTYTFTRDGERVTLRVRREADENSSWIARSEGKLPRWTVDRDETYTGTLRAGRLELTSCNKRASYSCTWMMAPVAKATAVRRPIAYVETPRFRWSPWEATSTRVLFCTWSDEPDQTLDPYLVFATPGIEHVMADNDCCRKPGASLRWIPRDGSLKPPRED